MVDDVSDTAPPDFTEDQKDRAVKNWFKVHQVVNIINMVGHIREEVDKKEQTALVTDAVTGDGALESDRSKRLNKVFLLTITDFKAALIIKFVLFLQLGYSLSFHPIFIAYKLYPDTSEPLWTLDLLTDILFLLEIAISFRTTFIQNGVEITDPALIARRYIKSTFLPDLISSLPLQLISYPSFLWLKLLRVTKLSHVVGAIIDIVLELPKQIQGISGYAGSFIMQLFVMRMVKYFIYMMLFCHLFVALLLVSRQADGEEVPDLTSDDYIDHFYFIITTLTTVGYGDQSPPLEGTVELVFVMILEIFGIFVYALIMGVVLQLFDLLRKRKSNEEEIVEDVEDWLYGIYKDNTRPPSDRANQAFDYHEARETVVHSEVYNLRRLFHEQNLFLSQMPMKYRNEIFRYVFGPYKENFSLFFKDCEDGFVYELFTNTRMAKKFKGDVLYHTGEKVEELYLMIEGGVELYYELEALFEFREGTMFGEEGLFPEFSKSAQFTAVVNEDDTYMYAAPLVMVQGLFKKYPKAKSALKEIARVRKKFFRKARRMYMDQDVEISRSLTSGMKGMFGSAKEHQAAPFFRRVPSSIVKKELSDTDQPRSLNSSKPNSRHITPRKSSREGSAMYNEVVFQEDDQILEGNELLRLQSEKRRRLFQRVFQDEDENYHSSDSEEMFVTSNTVLNDQVSQRRDLLDKIAETEKTVTMFKDKWQRLALKKVVYDQFMTVTEDLLRHIDDSHFPDKGLLEDVQRRLWEEVRMAKAASKMSGAT